MKKSSPALFELVQSLQRQEKRFVSRFIENNSYDANNMLLLLQAVSRQPAHNEAALKAWLGGKKAASLLRNFPLMKQKLYGLVMKALRLHTAGHTVAAVLNEQLRDIELLYHRNLYKQAAATLKRAKLSAEKHEKYWQLGQLLEWEKKLQDMQQQPIPAAKSIQGLRTEEDKLLARLHSANNYWYRRAGMRRLQLKQGPARDAASRQEACQLLQHPEMKRVKKSLSFEARRNYYLTYANYFLLTGDRAKNYHTLKKLIGMIEQQPWRIQDNPAEYVQLLYNFIFICRHFPHRRQETEQTLARLHSLSAQFSAERYYPIQVSLFRNSSIFELDYYIGRGCFEKAPLLATVVEEGIQKFDGQLTARDLIVLRLLLSMIHFGNGQYSHALDHINHVLNKAAPPSAQHTLSLSMIFSLLIHYELGNYALLEYKVRSVYRWLYRQNRLFELERTLLRFFRTSLPRVYDAGSLQAAFAGLRSQLYELMKIPAERQYLQNFDFIAWLDSKIEGRPFAEIVRERALTK